MLTNVGIAAIALGASLLQSVSGFGFGIVFMALTPLFIPYTTSVGISTILSGTLNLVILKRCWRDIDWKQLWLPVLFCLCGSSIGTFMMATAPSPIYKRLLGVFLIILAIWLSFFSDRVRIRKTTRNAGIAGVVSGLCGGLFSVNGPPMVLYFISVIEEKKTYLATLQAYFIINNIYLLIIRSASGLMPEGIGLSALFGLGGLLIGSFIGGKIFNKIDGKKLKKIVYIVMVVSGLWIAIHG
ncbi:MAG: sulfite exporter TauE/SafE family protein [Firmicutes bacterium]|nr:sulfite exporter TauE/SafE family protein [Bacillota bacterium]MBQ2270515.1 sulfite exporter TauE/SafE family protein [Bacillota bacterium]MBQ5796854.1 sulfite exporter TauE/SafE family protein [Bacillota bacterium]